MSVNENTLHNGGNVHDEEMEDGYEINHGHGDSNVEMFSNSRQTEILRCFAQYLLTKNYKDTFEKLVEESGVVLENRDVAELRTSVLNGNWLNAEESLENLRTEVNSDDNLKHMQFLILEQRILEALEEGNYKQGVELLRERLTPMNLNRDRVHHLATCLMYNEVSELHNMASWPGKNGGSREILVNKLQTYIPAQVMLPPERIDYLFNLALRYQLENCTYHNKPIDLNNQSLLQDHKCGIENFPSAVIQEIKIDKSELYMCKFSPDGLKLAVGGKHNNIDLLEVDLTTLKVSRMCEFACNGNLNYLTWSFDSKKLAASSSPSNSDDQEQDGVYVYDVASRRCICTISNQGDEPYNALSFMKDNNKLAIGSIKGIIKIIDVNNHGAVLATVDGYRAQTLVTMSNTTDPSIDSILVADSHKRIREYQFGYDQNHETSNGTSGGVGTGTGTGALSQQTPTESNPANNTNTVTSDNTDASPIVTAHTTGHAHNPSVAMIAAISSLAAASAQSPSSQTTTSSTSSTATSNTPLVIHHAYTTGTTSLTNQMFQWVSTTTNQAPATTTTTTSSSANTRTNWLQAAATTATSATNSVPPTSLDNAYTDGSNATAPYSLIRDVTLFEQDAPIQSMVISKDSSRLLISLNKVGLCMWDISSKQILKRFVGNEQKRFTLFPTFGGYNEKYIACGSETGKVYIWNENMNHPYVAISLLNGNNISCVHWNPANDSMLAAVNDAGYVYIIAPSRYGSIVIND